MRVVVQRVSRAGVTVGDTVIGEIDRGLLVLVGVAPADGRGEVEATAEKLVGLRIFPDDYGRMNRSVVDVSGSILVVSQFTLYGSVHRGRRPSFTAAAPPDHAAELIDSLTDSLAEHVPVETGRFGARMEVELVNDGPVTLVFDVVDGAVV